MKVYVNQTHARTRIGTPPSPAAHRDSIPGHIRRRAATTNRSSVGSIANTRSLATDFGAGALLSC